MLQPTLQQPLGYGQMPGYPAKPIYRGGEDILAWMREHQGLFPFMFTLSALAIFASPVITGVRMAIDPSVNYWIGTWAWIVLAIPALLLGSHLIHLWNGRPRFFPVLMSTVVPSLLIIIVGYGHSTLNGVSNRLLSTDCTTYREKFRIESAHRIAEQVMNSCITRVASETSISEAQARAIVRVQDCAEYRQYDTASWGRAQHGDFHKEWAYLQRLEEEQTCSGWCNAGPTLWAPGGAVQRDICTNTAAAVLEGQVGRWASRILCLGIVELLMSVLTIFLIQEALNKMGIEW